MVFHDVHCHIFNIEDIPLATFIRRFGIVMSIILRNFKFMSKDDKIRKFVSVSEKRRSDIAVEYLQGIAALKDKHSIKLQNFDKYVICPLTMDFSKESKIKKFEYQISSLLEALDKTKIKDLVEFRPFLGIRFSNKDNTKLVQKYVNMEKGPFYGIKLYPPLGFDLRRAVDSTVLKYAEENNIPVTTHCNDGGFPSMHISRRTAKKNTDPENWFRILDKLPQLRLNLAHMGGLRKSWLRDIMKLCKNYDNVYTDISYIIFKGEKVARQCNKFFEEDVGNKILFGTDWFMSSMEDITVHELCNEFIEEMDRYRLEKILGDNPEKFLY